MQQQHTHYLYMLLCVGGMSAGQLLFKQAALSIRDFSPAGLLGNGWLLLAVALYGATTLGWVWVLRHVPLALAYPFMSLAFVIVPVLAWLLWGEPVHWRTWAGSGLIIAGVALASTR